MECHRLSFLFVFIALSAKASLAAQHLVGGSQGWDESTDFNSWASGQKFKVGDTLAFKYTSGLHSVVEVANEAAYKNCDLGTALDSKNTGNDVVKLDKPGTRYFACGTLGHCGQGMKVKITIESGTSAPSSTLQSSSQSSPSVQASSASIYKIHSFNPFVLLVSVMVGAISFYLF